MIGRVSAANANRVTLRWVRLLPKNNRPLDVFSVTIAGREIANRPRMTHAHDPQVS